MLTYINKIKKYSYGKICIEDKLKQRQNGEKDMSPISVSSSSVTLRGRTIIT